MCIKSASLCSFSRDNLCKKGSFMSIKKISLVVFILISTSISLNAFTKAASNDPVLVQSAKEKHWCPVCGMHLKMFYKTNHTSKIEGKKNRQYCSVRCLVVDMKEHNVDMDSIEVVDAKTEKLIPAYTAFYVVGSNVKGTMSKVSKLAFASQADALEFMKKHKGEIVDFNAVVQLAQDSLQSDTAMIAKKKKKKIYPMGKKIFKKKCNQDIDARDYAEINELKSAMKNDKLCRPLKEKHLQAVALYLWEVKRFGDFEETKGKIEVQKHEKCPVCGMFTYKYPKWAAQIFYEDGGTQQHYSFDGVKDLMKFYFNPKEWGNYKVQTKDDITKILVTDYYSQVAIDATKAYYVIGSDVYGPMGDELIPFEHEEDAKTFYMDHKGTKVVKFSDITPQDIYKLDE